MKNVLQVSVIEVCSGALLSRAWFSMFEDALEYAQPILTDLDSELSVCFRWVGLEVIVL